MDELRVETHLKTGEIACNFDDLETALREQMQAYADLEVTEDNIPERKKDVATLRKFKDALDTRRKEIKADFNKPLKEFEERVKRLTGIIDTEVDRINEGLSAFEQKRIEAKKVHIKELYDKECAGYEEFLPLNTIYNSKWENKTCTDNEIISEMQEKVLRVKSDIEAIKGLNSEIEDKLIEKYKATGNYLAAAIAKNTEYMDTKRMAEERAKAEAEAAKRMAEEAQRTTVDVTVAQPIDDVRITQVPMSNLPSLTVRVFGNEDIEALRTFLKMSSINYEEVRA